MREATAAADGGRPQPRRRLRTSAVDRVMAVSDSLTSVPAIGKHLAPIGALTAAGMWIGGRAPGIASAALKTMFPGSRAISDEQRTPSVAELCGQALHGIVPTERLNIDWPPSQRLAPMLSYLRDRRRHLYRARVSYGDAPEQVLDIWRRRDLPTTPAPTLVFVPGGGWVHGRRALQGNALLSHLAERGWVCLSIDYRVAPRHPWPQHLNDVRAAVAWARANADGFGGDAAFLAIAGASAGGHLAAVAGLTADDPVAAVVGIYGRYDWEDRSTPERKRFMSFIERVVVKKSYDGNRELFRSASPIALAGPHAPAFLVVHGTADTIIPVAQAVAFADRLRATSRAAVGYLELPGAHHGFDMTDGTRTPLVVTAIGLFLDEVYRSQTLRSGTDVENTVRRQS
ncbi:alpha/beta hydrolase [Mycolicibacter sinensis]